MRKTLSIARRRFDDVALFALALAMSCAAPAAGQVGSTSYTFVSDGSCPDCDPVGRGESAAVFDPECVATRNAFEGVRLDFSTDPNKGNAWWMDFSAAYDTELQTGIYINAISWAEEDNTVPRFDIRRAPGTSCANLYDENNSTGSFTVNEVEYDQFGNPIRFEATFDQWCFDYNEGLHGVDVDYEMDAVLGSTILTPGNLLVTFRNRLYEHANPPLPPPWPFGISPPLKTVPIRRPPDFPLPGTVPHPDEKARDVAFDGVRDVHLVNGTATPVLTTFDTATGVWRNDTFPDWEVLNITGHGDPVVWGRYVFVNDADLAGVDNGIIRFDTADDFAAIRFAAGPGNSYQDLTIGFDGRLYGSVSGANETEVDVYDPDTLAPLGTVTLDREISSLAVNARGEFFATQLVGNGFIYHFDTAGNLIGQFDPLYVGGLVDIALSRSGQIAVGDNFKAIAITDETLSDADPYFLDFDGPGVYVSWIEPPPAPFQLDGFESGDASLWDGAVGDYAGVIEVRDAAAKSGAYGLEVHVGSTCLDPVDEVVPGPTATGLFRGCNQVSAGAVDVIAPGATFAAGNLISLGEDFTASSDFTTAIDSGFTSRLGWVEDALPAPAANYGAEFEINLDGLTLDPADDVVHFVGVSDAGDEEFRLEIIRNEGLMENRLVLAARLDDGTYAETPFGEQILLPAGWRTVRVIWRAGDGLGFLLVSLDGVGFVGLSNLDNDTRAVSSVRWGAAGGAIGGSTSGSIWLDDFSSWQ